MAEEKRSSDEYSSEEEDEFGGSLGDTFNSDLSGSGSLIQTDSPSKLDGSNSSAVGSLSLNANSRRRRCVKAEIHPQRQSTPRRRLKEARMMAGLMYKEDDSSQANGENHEEKNTDDDRDTVVKSSLYKNIEKDMIASSSSIPIMSKVIESQHASKANSEAKLIKSKSSEIATQSVEDGIKALMTPR